MPSRAFLLTPFSYETAGNEDPETFRQVQQAIESAAEVTGVELLRADDIFASGVIIEQVSEHIREADLVIAVCTGRNANVFFELGIADGARRLPILLASSRDDLPFDVTHWRAQFYGGEGEMTDFADRVAQAITETLAQQPRSASRENGGGLELSEGDFENQTMEAARVLDVVPGGPWSFDAIPPVISKGYWETTIRPASFDPTRIPYGNLQTVLEALRVELRGWDFPHIDRNAYFGWGADSIFQTSEWDAYREAWMFYQSGLLYQVRAMEEDWGAADRFPYAKLPEQKVLGIAGSLYQMVDAVEFGRRLSAREEVREAVTVVVTANGLADRRLAVDSPRLLPKHDVLTASISELSVSADVRSDSDVRSVAAELVRDLFLRFGYSPKEETLPLLLNELRWTE